MIVIGVNGPAGSGKDTASNYILKTYGFERKVSFAENFKDMCHLCFQVPIDKFYDDNIKNSPLPDPVEFNGRHLTGNRALGV